MEESVIRRKKSVHVSSHMAKQKILLLANTSWYLYNFRLSLMKTLQKEGFSVITAAPYDDYTDKLKMQGFDFIPIAMNNKGTNPIEELCLIRQYFTLLKRTRPDAILTYTPKPNIYASIAAGFLSITVVNNIAGLGSVFIKPGLISLIVQLLYRMALRKSKKVFFQNNDDLKLFLAKNLVNKAIVKRIPGSGVDTNKFVPLSKVESKGKFVFLMITRMLWDKGVYELVKAMRMLKPKHPHIECRLLGFLDVQSPGAISSLQMQEWVAEGVVSYLGVTDNVAESIRDADCIVLPSYYREGVPRTILEAASMAKPVITTDSIGCRDAVEDEKTGYLCKARDAGELAKKMALMINMPEKERLGMGKLGREKMIDEFDERIVIKRYLEVISAIIKQ